MPFCPNPDCPHIKKIGEPAEFKDGVVNCSDCGVVLTEERITFKKEKKTPNDFIKRLIYTLFIVAIWRASSHIAIPGIEFLRHGEGIPFLPYRLTVFSLGLMPYITAYIIVEILALFLNPLKSWRANGSIGRTKLKKTALFATLFLALIQGLLIVNKVGEFNEGQLIHEPKWIFKIVIVLTLIAGVFISLWFAKLITKKGVGHGIGVLILSSFAARIFYEISGVNINWGYLNHSPFEIILFITAVFLALVALIIFFETSFRKIPVKFSDGTEAVMPLKLTTAGIIPADWALSLIILPVTLVSFIDNSTVQSIAVLLIPGTLLYSIVHAVIIILLCYFFTALFYRPQKMIDFLKSKNAYISLSSEGDVGKHIDKTLEIMAFWAALYLCVIVITPNILIKNSVFPVFLGGVALIEAVAISLDLLGELKIRRKNKKLVKIAEFHNIQIAGLCKSLLEQHSITCCLRGYYFRALLYFFGPYIEISAMVPEDKADEASELVKRYIEQ